MRTQLRPSGIRAVFDRALELEASGRSIIHLEIGRPHFDSPHVAKRAAIGALEEGDVHYTPNRGRFELRAAIADRLLVDRGLSYDPEVEIVVTAGGSEAVGAAMFAQLEEGEEVILLEPCWPHYEGLLRLTGAIPVRVATRASDGFLPDPEDVSRAITPRTRMILISSPSNPTGAVIDAERLSALAELCERHDLTALSDEIYHRFTYDQRPHVSIAALPGMRQRTVIADSLSKTYSMTGWRVGYVAAPSEIAARINVVHQHLTVCAASFAQAGALAALRDGEEHVARMVSEYGTRRREVIRAFAGLPAIELQDPAGAFYAFPRVEAEQTEPDLAYQLLERAGVAVVPGEVFGTGLQAHIRLSYAVSAEELQEGLTRIADAFQ